MSDRFSVLHFASFVPRKCGAITHFAEPETVVMMLLRTINMDSIIAFDKNTTAQDKSTFIIRCIFGDATKIDTLTSDGYRIVILGMNSTICALTNKALG